MDERGVTVPPMDVLSATAQRFAALAAEGQPAVFRPSAAIFTVPEVMSWIAAAHRAADEQPARQKLRVLHQSLGLRPEDEDSGHADPGRPAEFYRDGGLMLDGTRHLPRNAESFDAWVKRVRDALGGRFGMQAPGIESASFDALDRLQTLLGPVLETTGPRTYRYNAFAGDYDRTPFGFHVDPHQAMVFQVVLVGKRRASFWDARRLGDSDTAWLEDTNRLTSARPPDVVFDLEPGDVVFWPGHSVHGMEPDGASLGLSMVIDRASPRTRGEVVTALEIETAGGRPALPPMDGSADVQASEVLVRRSRYPLAYERYDDTLIVGVCGRTFDWPDPDSIVAAMRLVDELNAAPDIAVAEVLQRCADPTLPGELIVEVLRMLRALGFFR